MQSEVALVIQSPEFVRSPVLRKLLEYLVAQTLAGNGARLKAYQIAVEGLGRDDDFDPQSDSYPRVQVGRLRKMLDAYYAALPADAAQGRRRIVVPMGQYEVLLQPITSVPAEPVSPPVDAVETSPATPQTTEAQPDTPPPLPSPVAASVAPNTMDRGWLVWVFRALVLLALLYVIWLLARPDTADQSASLRNLNAQLAHVTIQTEPPSGNDDLTTAAQIAEMHLQRFEMLAVTMDDGNTTPLKRDAAREYQLLLRGGTRPGGAQGAGPIFLTLRHGATGTTLWSREVVRSEGGELPDVERTIGSGVSQIARSGGLIAQHQRRLIGKDMTAGYPCLIQYDSFRQKRDLDLRAPLQACLTQSLERYPNEPLILQALSYLALSAPRPDRRAPLVASAKGRELAEAALQFNAGSALAQIAVSRSALARGNCARAIAFARRAVESNPLEPDTLGLAGTFLMSCGDYAGAEPVLERSMTMGNESDGYRTASLIITRLINGKPQAALDLALLSETQTMIGQPNFLLARALALAANGRKDAARRTWAELEKSVGTNPGAPVADVLAKFTMSPRFTRRMQAEAERLGLATATGAAG